MKLKGKRFVITGSATGMGAATTVAFVREGAEVVGFYRSRGYEALAERLAGEPGSAHFVKVDVSEKDEVFPAMAAAAERLGGIDGLVHAAAICPTTAAEDISIDQLMEVMRVNVGGTMLTNQAVLPYLQANGGGRILNFASSTGATGSAIKADYAASKGAVLAWSRSVASAWAKHNITVNMICPVISTDMYQATRDAMTPEQLAGHDASLATAIPLGGKFGDPDRDFAPVAVFLAGDGARFMTGQMFSVDGGVLMVR
jgi:NAD(P)-dependent dehydrogenase (short-subunit alcohol dehydrogenase family)